MEHITYSFANFIGGGIMLLIGLILRFVQGSEELMAGYNTMKKTERAKWNATKMRRFLGATLTIVAGVLLIGGVLSLLGVYPDITMAASWSVFVGGIMFCVIYLNVSSKFKI